MRNNHAISLLGNPKGAMVTHANMISEVSAIQFLLAKVCVMFLVVMVRKLWYDSGSDVIGICVYMGV